MAGRGMTLRQMEVFYAIMRTGSVTGAAALLNATQPGISTVLRHCETQLGLRLFERIGGRLHATPEATELLPDIEAVFTRIAFVDRRTQDLRTGRHGALTIAAAFPIANGFLAPVVADFMRGHEGVTVTLQSLTSPQVVDRVVNREVELGIASEMLDSPAVEAELLLNVGVACVMRADHALAGRKTVDVGDLTGEPLITYLPQIPLRTLVDHAFIQGQVSPRIVAEVTISLTGIKLAAAGAGIALVDPLMAADMASQHLVARPLHPEVSLRTVLLRNKNAPRSRLMAAFVQDLRRRVQAEWPGSS